jgi:hypothetical protein
MRRRVKAQQCLRDNISRRGPGKDGSAAYEGALLVAGSGAFLADAMDHQGCLSEVKREEGGENKGETRVTILVANDPQTHATSSIKRNNAKDV